MNVAFRVDASAAIGTGHVMRCMALADALGARGIETRFVCRGHRGHLLPLLERKHFPVTMLPEPVGACDASSEDYRAWLGASPEEDARQTIAALGGRSPDWLVVDHYGIDAPWEQQLRPHVGQILAIDDLANRQHSCDALLDQNYSLRGDERYAGLVPPTCRLMTGPRYALLAPEFAAFRRTAAPRDGELRRVLVFFGGSDPQNMTQAALEALSAPQLQHLAVDVVIGANNVHRGVLEQLGLTRPLITIHGPVPHLARLMVAADLAIGAGGTTTWERMCLGLPSILVSIAENQKPACRALSESHLVLYAGHLTEATPSRLAEMVQTLCRTPGKMAEMSAASRSQVDGVGATRVAEVLFPTRVGDIRLRPATVDNVFGVVAAPDARDFQFEAAGLPVARVRVRRHAEEEQVGWTLDAVAERRDWTAPLLARAIRASREATAVPLGAHARPVFVRKDAGYGLRRTFSIVILSDPGSWVNDHVAQLQLGWLDDGHRVLWVHDRKNLLPGDFCFLLGCGQLVPAAHLAQYKHSLVVHESDLPEGKGWSPLTWQVLEKRHRIPVTLLEAAEKVDSGAIHAQRWIVFEGHELIDEMRLAVGLATVHLCRQFVAGYPGTAADARRQSGKESSYARRTPADSRLDPSATIESQFDLLRVVDSERYPAFFDYRGQRYVLTVRKAGNS